MIKLLDANIALTLTSCGSCLQHTPNGGIAAYGGLSVKRSQRTATQSTSTSKVPQKDGTLRKMRAGASSEKYRA